MEQVNTLQQQLKEQEKLASLGMLSAGIAHEIQNPLNFVINFSKLSVKLVQDLEEVVEANKSSIPADDYADMSDIIHSLSDNMSKIAEHGDRAVEIIRSILLVSSSCLRTSAGRSRSMYGCPSTLCVPSIRGSTSASTRSMMKDFR